MSRRNYKKLEPVPESGIRRVTEILEGGNLFRYAPHSPEESDVALFEVDFRRDWAPTMRYSIAVNSGSSAIQLALRALGVGPGDKVFVPAFTFTAVPSAVENLYAVPILVECGRDFKVDIENLKQKLDENPDVKVFLLSHMRGWISDMDAITGLCSTYRIPIVEDAAHALGSLWDGKLIGTFGVISTYSFQSYKIINAGEGGMVATDDDELAARMLFDQGAYEELYKKHLLRPRDEVLRKYLNLRPLFNMRMSNVTAAIARCQLPLLKERVKQYAHRYEAIVRGLRESDIIDIPEADPREERVLDSIQFRLNGFTPEMMEAFIGYVNSRNIPLAAFGVGDNARSPWNWRYIASIGHEKFPKTHTALDTACDMRLTTTMDDEDCSYFVQHVLEGIEKAKAMQAPVAS